jgi:outer membrane receptor for ferrienterochelin and colicins
MKKSLSIFACSALVTFANAQNVDLGTITVNAIQSAPQKPQLIANTVKKTEVITKKEMEQDNAQTLTQAIEHTVGVHVATGCSICGLKRVRLDGLKADYTTVLVDGIPFNSTVSSFYGLDAVNTASIERIDITRGAGASLTAPNAIAGTINIIPARPHKDSVEVDGSIGTLGDRTFSLTGQRMSKDKKTGVLVSASYYTQGHVDRDHNGVSESPSMKNQSASVMLTHTFSPYDSIIVHGAHFSSNVLGGSTVSYDDAVSQMINNPSNTKDQSNGFVGGNVNNQYIGQPLLDMEKIDTTRDEVYLKERHALTNSIDLKTTLAYAQQHQSSMYEGNDYNNDDKTYYVDFKSNYAINDNHFLTYGVDTKVEQMRSHSYKYYVMDHRPTDDFNYIETSLYGQDDWTIDEKNELIFALRGTHIEANWLSLPNKLDKTVLAPRLLFKHHHTDALTSRFSAGMGYRTPLSFFESDHGILDNGFGVDVTHLERSLGANYSLSYDVARFAVTGSLNYTRIQNLAYIDDSSGISVLKNASRAVNVKSADINMKYAATTNLTLAGHYSVYNYSKNYKAYLTLPAIEERAYVSADYHQNGWEFFGDATWVGARNLDAYGFSDVYNDTAKTSPKDTKAPSYVTVDLKISKKIGKTWTLYAGANNLFDFVQTTRESPLYYDADGNFNTTMIWGPLRGRELYAGLKAVF